MNLTLSGFISSITGFTILLILVSLFPNLSSAGDVYFSGFVKDKFNNGIEDAVIVITSEHKRIYSLKSKQNGWFEVTRPLTSTAIDQTYSIDVFKRGFKPVRNKKLVIDGFNNRNDQLMTRMTNIQFEENDSEIVDNVRYGYVYAKHKDTFKPIQGAVITVRDKKSNAPVSSAVSRSSGYFNLYYQEKNIDSDGDYNYSIEHLKYDTNEDDLEKFESRIDLFEVELKQYRYDYSIGPALHIQFTDEGSDKEFGGALLLNISSYPEKLLVVDNFFPRYSNTGFISYDYSVGLIPYYGVSNGKEDLNAISLVGFGVSYALDKILLPVRFGISYSDTEKFALYIGVNVPIWYF